MEADFVQQVYVPLLDNRQNSRGRIFHRSPDRFLMRFTEPQGDIIVADGRYFWMYYPSNDPRQVIRSPMSAGGQRVDLHREFLSNATERFSATRTGSETVGGRAAHALTLTPRSASPYRRVRLWVDAEDFLVRRFEIVEQNDTERRLELSNLRTNVTLGDDLFRFTPPPGAEVFEP
jgi:outer membrane lipoprotein carrier protein